MNRLSVAVIAIALLVLPASASAATIGSAHQDDATWNCDTTNPCVLVQDKVGGNTAVGAAPGTGTINSFTVGSATGPFTLLVLRGAGSTRSIVTETAQIDGDGDGSLSTYELITPIAVRAGDKIAVKLGAISSVGVRDLSATPTGNNMLQYSADGLWALQDQGPVELSLSANFVPASTPKPPPRVVVPPPPDPLADLKAGKKPKASIAGGSVRTTAKRIAAVTVTNPNGYALKGSLSLVAGKLKLGKKKVDLPAGASESIKVKLSRKGMKRLRKKRKLKATAVTKLKGPVGKTGVTRKKLTLKAPAKKKKKRKKKGSGGQPGGGGNAWKARFGDSGAYDDFTFRLVGNQVTLTKRALPMIGCFENGDNYESSFSFEVFDAFGPYTLGAPEAKVQKQGIAVNRLVGSGKRSITYKFKAARSGGKITGTLGMSFSDSRYNPFDNTITFVNCFGTPKFEAVPG